MAKKKMAMMGAGICATAAMAIPAPAATVVTSGSTYDGWIITVSQGISLTEDSSNPQDLDLTKSAAFSSMEGLLVTFTERSTSASPTITIQDETLTNNTGTSWGGFEFLLMDPNSTSTFTTSGGSPFAPPTGFSLLPDAGSDTSIIYAGAQATGAKSIWGLGANGGDLTISTDPAGIATTFVLTEIPLTTSFVSGLPGHASVPVAVPLPPALWEGLAGLASLALIGAAKHRRRRSA